MLVIRLLRKGRKHQPFYKIVVTDKAKSSTGGRFVEEVGFYNPKTKEKSLSKERILYWISKGVKPSDTVYNMMVSEKILEGSKIDVHKKSKKEIPADKTPVTPVEEKKEATTPTGEEKPAEPVKEEIKEPLVEQKEETSAQESEK
jgi:small subunit ribosomal protein S16